MEEVEEERVGGGAEACMCFRRVWKEGEVGGVNRSDFLNLLLEGGDCGGDLGAP